MHTLKTCLLALDQGRSSSRSIVLDTPGQIVAMAPREARQIYPQPGNVEHALMELWRAQLATAREALATADRAAIDIASMASRTSARQRWCGVGAPASRLTTPCPA